MRNTTISSLPCLLLTGATSRVGVSLAHALAHAGYDLILHINASAEKGYALAADLAAYSGTYTVRQADFAALDAHGARALAAPALPHQTVRGIVHNACLFAHNHDDPSGARHIAVNVTAPFLITHALYAQGIIQSTPMRSLFLLDGTVVEADALTHYVASQKAGAASVRALATHDPARLTVRGLALGPVVRHPRQSEAHFARLVAQTPEKRAVTFAEISAHVLRFMSGQKSLNVIESLGCLRIGSCEDPIIP